MEHALTTGAQPEPEIEVQPPPGIALEYPAGGGILVRLSVSAKTRFALAVPRLLLLLLVSAVLVEAWRHRLFIVFWFFGLPFLRWLRGPGQSALLIGDRSLDVQGAHWFGGTRSLPRVGIERISVGRAGPLQAFQRALLVQDKDRRTTRVLLGISAVQADFINGGLQRWLAGEG